MIQPLHVQKRSHDDPPEEMKLRYERLVCIGSVSVVNCQCRVYMYSLTCPDFETAFRKREDNITGTPEVAPRFLLFQN